MSIYVLVVAASRRVQSAFSFAARTGFKLFSIRPGTIFTKLGVQNGDVIQKVNGHELSSPQAAVGLLPVLTTAEEITVDVVRRGRRMTLRYRLH